MNITAVAGAHADEQGLASGLFIAAFQIGSGVVLGIVAAVFAANVDLGLDAYRAGISDKGRRRRTGAQWVPST
jgi:hypothetical protein